MSKQQKQICPKCGLIGFREEEICSFCQGAKPRDDSEFSNCSRCSGRFYKRKKSNKDVCIICKDKTLPVRVCACGEAFRSSKYPNCLPCRKRIKVEAERLKRERTGVGVLQYTCKFCQKGFARYASLSGDKERCDDCIRIQTRAGKAPIEAVRIRESIFKQAEKQAKKRKLGWTLTQEAWYSLIRKPCTYCQAPLKIKGGYIQLDRIDVSKGYHLNNILPCCGPCNLIRGSRVTPAEMVEFMKGVLEHRLAMREIDRLLKS